MLFPRPDALRRDEAFFGNGFCRGLADENGWERRWCTAGTRCRILVRSNAYAKALTDRLPSHSWARFPSPSMPDLVRPAWLRAQGPRSLGHADEHNAADQLAQRDLYADILTHCSHLAHLDASPYSVGNPG